MKAEIMRFVEKEKIIAIMREIEVEKCLKVADALYEGGIRLVEVTFNQKNPNSFKDTTDAIRAIIEKYAEKMLVGAGTVVSPTLVEMAADAGAKYIISPDVNINVINKTLELGLVSMPGALTPSEIMTAHNAGADYVKLFPIGELGVSYIKAVRAPISHIKLLGVGGVNENNAADYMNAGMCGIGVGGNLANKTWINNGEYYKITETAKKLVEAVNNI